jgi:hypothetical protein
MNLVSRYKNIQTKIWRDSNGKEMSSLYDSEVETIKNIAISFFYIVFTDGKMTKKERDIILLGSDNILGHDASPDQITSFLMYLVENKINYYFKFRWVHGKGLRNFKYMWFVHQMNKEFKEYLAKRSDTNG